MWRSSKILITGSEGFIGKNLTKSLPDCEVVELNEDFFDCNHLDDVEEFLGKEKPGMIFHVGACSDTLERDVNYMMERNYEFSVRLSDWAARNNAGLVYSSSAAVYGIDGVPSNLYAWSKKAAEEYILKNGQVALRYFNVYGPGEEEKGKMASVVYQAMQKKKRGEFFRLFPNNPMRDFVYIKDVVSANLFAADVYDELKGLWFEVGSGEPRLFEDIVKILDVGYTFAPEEFIPEGYQFFTRSKRENWLPLWKPKFSLEKGIQDYSAHEA